VFTGIICQGHWNADTQVPILYPDAIDGVFQDDFGFLITLKEPCWSQVWWYTPEIPVFKRHKQEDQQLKTKLGKVIETLSQKLNKNQRELELWLKW
jgi:hypothetical protein